MGGIIYDSSLISIDTISSLFDGSITEPATLGLTLLGFSGIAGAIRKNALPDWPFSRISTKTGAINSELCSPFPVTLIDALAGLDLVYSPKVIATSEVTPMVLLFHGYLRSWHSAFCSRSLFGSPRPVVVGRFEITLAIQVKTPIA